MEKMSTPPPPHTHTHTHTHNSELAIVQHCSTGALCCVCGPLSSALCPSVDRCLWPGSVQSAKYMTSSSCNAAHSLPPSYSLSLNPLSLRFSFSYHLFIYLLLLFLLLGSLCTKLNGNANEMMINAAYLATSPPSHPLSLAPCREMSGGP